MDADVVVVGAGPVGLLVAAELALAGVRPLVLERATEPSGQPKARGIGPLAAEALRRRGLGDELDREHELGLRKLEKEHGTTRGHFAWIHKLDPDPERRGALIGQPALEAVLRRYLGDLGGEVRYGHTVSGWDDDVLTVETPTGTLRVTAGYVVGCDGGRSAVRKLAGFDFVGTAPLMTVRFARAKVSGELPPPGRLANGTLFYEDGMVATYDFLDTEPDRSAPLSGEEMRASVERVAGVAAEVSDFQGGMRFSDQARQVSTYRRGRTLLAGDAAHVHSPSGGQGLNLGLMDAMNLGWKLAAAVRGNDALLDSYTSERHPVGAAVLANTRAQSALLAPGPHVDALREVFSGLMDLSQVNQYLTRLLSGVETRYEMPYPVSHPMVGMACPPPAPLMTNGRPVLLKDLDDDRFDAVLLRPDGVIAWATAPGDKSDGDGVIAWATAPGDKSDADGLRQALDTWFGGAQASEYEQPGR